jgi:hypothetical protein
MIMTPHVAITKYDDIINSRDVKDIINYYSMEDLSDWTTEERDEYDALVRLDTAGRDASPCWNYGVTLIRDSYFVTFAQQHANNIGQFAGGESQQWPYSCIDWEAAARELQQDYTAVKYDNVTYWVR